MEKIRVTAYVEPESYQLAEKFAKGEKRSLSQMIAILVEEAVQSRLSHVNDGKKLQQL